MDTGLLELGGERGLDLGRGCAGGLPCPYLLCVAGGYGPPPAGRGAPPPPPPFTSYIVSTPPGGFPPPQGFPQGYGAPPQFSECYPSGTDPISTVIPSCCARSDHALHLSPRAEISLDVLGLLGQAAFLA